MNRRTWTVLGMTAGLMMWSGSGKAEEQCVADYAAAFGNDRVTLTRDNLRLSVASDNGRVEIIADTELPGFRIERNEGAMAVQVGVLAGDRLFYLDKDSDQYLSMEDLTRRALDRVLFPKLKD